MLLLTETILFYWDLFDASSSAKEFSKTQFGKVRDWAQNNAKSRISGARTNASRVTSVSQSRVSSLAPSKSLGVKVKGSTKSSHSIPTQLPATPASAIDQDLPVSYFDEDDDLTEFTSPAQESIAKECDVSYSVIIDTEVSCMTWWNRRL